MRSFVSYVYALNSPYKFTDPLGLIPSTTGACGQWCQNYASDQWGGSTDFDSLAGAPPIWPFIYEATRQTTITYRGENGQIYRMKLTDVWYENSYGAYLGRKQSTGGRDSSWDGNGQTNLTSVKDDPNLEVENRGVVITFYLESQELFVQEEMDANGNRSEFIIEGVTSGRGNCMNNPKCARDRNIGPIPAGAYFLNANEIDEVGIFRAWLRSWTGDWGSFRVPLIPFAGTNIDDSNGKRRSGFKLHGGNVKGSAGCIDGGGGYGGSDATRRLLQTIRSDSSKKVIVYCPLYNATSMNYIHKGKTHEMEIEWKR